MNPDFNRAAAKAAGYTDAEIDAFLASRSAETPEPTRRTPTPAGVPEMAPRESTTAPRAMSLGERVQEQGRREQRQEQTRQTLTAIPAAIANVSRDIPGAEMLQAGVRSIARNQPYREALGDIRQATDALPAPVRVTGRVAGAALAGAAMPVSGRLRLGVQVPGTKIPLPRISDVVQQGAAYGAASGLTEASPDIGVGERVGRAVGQAALGGTVAKAAKIAGTSLRSVATPSRADLLLRQAEATSRRAGPQYEQFKALGTLPRTQALDDILDLPMVRTALAEVKGQSPRLRNLPDTDARVLDAVYKRVGSRAFTAKHKYEPNEAREALMAAIDDASGGLYRPPVETFRIGSQRSQAIQRGARAAQTAVNPSGGGATIRSALETSPEALAKWAQTATPAQRRAAVQGVLSGLGSRAASDLSRINVFQPLGWFTAARRANISANMIDDVERLLPRSPVRRTGGALLPTYLTPRDRTIPESP